MNAPAEIAYLPERPCDIAMRRLKSAPLEPIMFCNWQRVLFINLEVDKAALQREVPFALDLYDGRAFVSLVAFHVRDIRPRFCGAVGKTLFRPLEIGELFNVRTYVRSRGEPAIYFLSEWLGSRINLHLGPTLYGLPYRFGRMRYNHDEEAGEATGEVCDRGSGARVRYRVNIPGPFIPAVSGSLDEFLVERYSCFTHFRGPRRYFRIWHEPWPQARVEVQEFENDLLVANWPWLSDAKVISANYSPGLDNIWLGRPHILKQFTRRAFMEFP